MIAVDSNVLIAAHRSRFVQHDAALAAVRRLAEGDEAFGIPVFVLAEFVRVVTHPRFLRPPTPIELAIRSLDHLTARAGARLLSPGDDYWSHLRAALQEGRATGNRAFDAQIAAVCREHGVHTILTEDRDFLRFPWLEIRTLEDLV